MASCMSYMLVANGSSKNAEDSSCLDGESREKTTILDIKRQEKMIEDVETKLEKAKDNIIKKNQPDILIDKVERKILQFWENRLQYNTSKKPKYLKKSQKLVLEAKFLMDRIHRISELNNAVFLKEGLIVVSGLAIGVCILLTLYSYSHFFHGISWFMAPYWVEVIFFSLFGVLTNLTYSATKHVIKRDFDLWHLGWYISKIPQAPFIALAFILFFKHINIEAFGIPITLGNSPPEVIVAIAYILGLFSRRTWEFIERIKDWLLPLGNKKIQTSHQASGAASSKGGGTTSTDPGSSAPPSHQKKESPTMVSLLNASH